MLKDVAEGVPMDRPVFSHLPLPPAALAALQQGQKIEAIKIVRETQFMGLKEAKDCVEQYVANDPLLRERFATSQGSFQRGCLVVAVGLIALLGAALFLFFGAQR